MSDILLPRMPFTADSLCRPGPTPSPPPGPTPPSPPPAPEPPPPAPVGTAPRITSNDGNPIELSVEAGTVELYRVFTIGDPLPVWSISGTDVMTIRPNGTIVYTGGAVYREAPYTATVTSTNSLGAASVPFTLHVREPVVIDPPPSHRNQAVLLDINNPGVETVAIPAMGFTLPDDYWNQPQPCISPDGTHVIWAKKDGSGRVSAWVRRIA